MQAPAPGQVRIRVEACGVCHSDAGTVEGLFPIDWPPVPGHEVVGRIDALGSGIQGWAVGQRVGTTTISNAIKFAATSRVCDQLTAKVGAELAANV